MKRKLGEILVAAGAVSSADIDLALIDQSAGEPARLGDLLVALGKVTPLQLAQALCEQYGLPFTEVPPVPSAVLEAVPLELQRQFRFVPIDVQGGSISIAMADPSFALREVLPVLKKRFTSVKIFVAASDEVDSVHATLSGDYGPLSLSLPHVAPAIAPVRTRPSPSPTADELFGSLDLDAPSDFELELPSAVETPRPARQEEEEEPFFFEATAVQTLAAAPPPPLPASRPISAPPPPLPASRPISAPLPPVAATRPISAPLPPLAASRPLPAAPLPAAPPMSSSPSFPELTIEEPVSSELELSDPSLTDVTPGDLQPFDLPDAMPEYAFDAPPPMTDVPWDAAAAVAAEPMPDALAETAAFFDSQFGSTPSAQFASDTVLDDAGELIPLTAELVDVQSELVELPEESETSVEVSFEEDTPFFDAPQAGPAVASLGDEAFVSGVPSSSPSSLARLEIEPEQPMVPTVPPISLTREASMLEPEPAPQHDADAGLPAWLNGGGEMPAAPEPAVDEWNGELERLSSSRLIVGVTKALLKRGLLTRAEILEALGEGK